MKIIEKYPYMPNRLRSTDIGDLYLYLFCREFTDDTSLSFEIEFRINKIKEKLLNECQNILLRELRHADEYLTGYSKYGIKRLVRQLKWRYGHEGRSRNDPYFSSFCVFKDFKHNLNYKFLGKIMADKNWNMYYAGDGYIKVANYCDLLVNCRSNEAWFYVDRLVNCVHNNGRILSKFYYSPRIKEALCKQSCVKSIHELPMSEVGRKFWSKFKYKYQHIDFIRKA